MLLISLCIKLTAWPWAECGSCSAWGLFYFFSFVADQMQTSAQPCRGWDFESHNL